MPGSRKFLVVHGHHRLARRVVLRQAHSANCLSKIVARLRKLCNNKMGIMQASTNLILAADFISSVSFFNRSSQCFTKGTDKKRKPLCHTLH